MVSASPRGKDPEHIEADVRDLTWWHAPLIAANVSIDILIMNTHIEHACLVGWHARGRR